MRQSNRERGWELGADGAGRLQARDGQHKSRGASATVATAEAEAATGTASGRRGQVPMSAQVSPHSRFSAVQCSASFYGAGGSE